MLFDVKAALAEILDVGVAIPAIFAISQEEPPAKSQESRQLQPSRVDLPAQADDNASDPPALVSADGYCRTWSGRIVRLDEWRRLSEWDRHGPDGRMFCGICNEWAEPKGTCSQASCWRRTSSHRSGSQQ
ncbi:hypothetical protein [Paracoccus everestensis]|uniref:hypothetical protein n=1 Tax=Paracoccus everestensis TaxID=2903900 RepID=UPI001F3D5CC2|nr:hypothetical protein [Paracoccus everestensis]